MWDRLLCAWLRSSSNHLSHSLFLSLAARVGRKRGKMNLEKAMNKNMFDMSNAVREQNPLATAELMKSETNENSSLSSILTHPKQKLTAQFKRAITMMKQRSEPTHDSPPTLRTSSSLTEKPLNSFDSSLLTSLIEEPSSSSTIKASLERSLSIHENNPPTATIVNLDSCSRVHPTSPSSSTVVKKSLQQIHSSILQSMNPSPAMTSSSSGTIAVPTSSSSSNTGTGDIIYLETLL